LRVGRAASTMVLERLAGEREKTVAMRASGSDPR
jgi:hypothetical protein